MTVKASYQGMDFEFPDGTPDEVIYSHIQSKFQEGNKDYGSDKEGTGWGIGSWGDLGSSITEGWSSMTDAVMAANVGSDMQEEALRQYELQEARARGHEEKLGTAGQILSGLGRYGPAIGAGVVGSMATGGLGGAAIGAGVSGAMSSADALRAQYEQNNEFDTDRALLAGAATGVTDLATGGLGKFIAKPGASLLSRATQQAKTIAAEDMTSAAASKVYENWAARKDLTEDVGMAALMGGASGAGVRGGIHQGSKIVGKFKDAARDMGVAPNKGSEQSIQDTTSLEMGPGPSPSEGFADDFINFSTISRNARDDVNGAVDEADLTGRIQGLNKILEDGAHLDATARFGKALQSDKAHIIDSIFDANIETPDGKVWNIGRDGLNLKEDQMVKAREDLTRSVGHNIPFMSREGELAEGITGVSFNEKSQEFGRGVRKKMQGNMDKNLTMLKEKLRIAEMDGSGASASEKALLKDAVESYGHLKEAATSYNKESDGIDTSYTAKIMAQRFNDSATRLGIADDILDINGSKGNLNPLADWQAFTAITEGFRQQNKQFSQGKPDTLKPLAANAGLGTAAGIGYLIHPGVAASVAAGKAAHELYKIRGRAKGRSRVAEAKARVGELTPEVTMFERSLDGGDGPGAAAAAAKDLEAQGINTQQPVPVQPSAVEAPVSTPESVTPTRKADAKVRKAPAQKAVQEPVVEAPKAEVETAPKPKPEAKAKALPKQSRKEKAEARKAEADARRQAKQAAIAAKMQEDIQAGTAKREPLGRSAPKAKEEAPVETPVESVVESIPAPKPEAKAKAKPAQKAVEEPVVEEVAPVTPEPAIEAAPTVKPDAKVKPAPKEKAVEPEPVKEAPQKAAPEPLGRVKPQRVRKEQKPVEEVVEAPVKEAEPEPKKAPAAKLVREPLKQKAEEAWPVGRRKQDPAGYREHLKAQENLKEIDIMMRTNDKYSEEDIAQTIQETGGADKFLAAAKEVKKSPSEFLKLRMRELERLRSAEGKVKTEEMREIIKSQKDTAKPKGETVDPKVERTKLDRKEFDDEMEALAIHPDDVAQVNKAISDKDFSLKNARKMVSRLHNERKARMKDDMDADAASLKAANSTLDLQGRRAQVDEYVSGLKVEGDSTIQGMVDDVFKHNDTKVTPKEVQNLLNKIDHYLAAEQTRYKSIDKADPRAPEYQTKAAAYRSAQNTLKSTRREVDRKYSRAEKDAQEATEALSKAEADYDKLFRQANERDANIVQVRNQKDELFSKLTDLGFDEMDVRKFVGSTFFERNTTPLTELGKKHVIEKFIDQQAQTRKQSIESKANAVKEVVKDTEDGTVIQMSNDLMQDIEFNPKVDSADELLAMTQALHDEAAKRGLTKEATRLKLFNEGIIEGKINKVKYPDNPELWVPYEVKTGIQDTFGTAGSAYAGNLLKKINAAVTGDSDGVKGFMTKPRNAMKGADAAMRGKMFTGDDDIVAK